jgi:hypothetical protein
MTELDLYLQDFVSNNKLLGVTMDWATLVNRRFVETPGRKIFSFLSGGKESLVVGELLKYPDAEWFRLEFDRVLPATPAEQRFDCLRMMHQPTHYQMDVTATETDVTIKLLTRHRGLVNVAIVIRSTGKSVENPFLCV